MDKEKESYVRYILLILALFSSMIIIFLLFEGNVYSENIGSNLKIPEKDKIPVFVATPHYDFPYGKAYFFSKNGDLRMMRALPKYSQEMHSKIINDDPFDKSNGILEAYRIFMSNKELLSELPSQALCVVCRKTTGTDPTTRSASALHVFHSQGPSRSFRARTPLAFSCPTNRLREHPKKLPKTFPSQGRTTGRGRLAANLRLLCR